MNIVDKLIGRGQEPELSLEERTRHDVLFTQLRARTGLPAENIDLSGVDFSKPDDELRAEVAKARGITSAEATAQIDLDEVIIPSGEALRRARRRAERADRARKARGQRAYNRLRRKNRGPATESGSAKVKRQRAEKAATLAIGALIRAARANGENLLPTAAEEQLRELGHPAILKLDELRAA